jgi:hypothetical protein
MDTKPILLKLPNTHGEAAMDEKVICSLHHLLAKRAKAAIWPSPLLEPIGGP